MVTKFLKFANRPLPGWLTLAIFMVASASAAYTYTGGINVPTGATDTHAATIVSTVPANNVSLGQNLTNTNAPNFLQFPNTSTNVGSNHVTNIGTSGGQSESGIPCTILAVADSGVDQRLCVDRLGNQGIPATASYYGGGAVLSGPLSATTGTFSSSVAATGFNGSALTASQCLGTDASKNLASSGNGTCVEGISHNFKTVFVSNTQTLGSTCANLTNCTNATVSYGFTFSSAQSVVCHAMYQGGTATWGSGVPLPYWVSSSPSTGVLNIYNISGSTSSTGTVTTGSICTGY